MRHRARPAGACAPRADSYGALGPPSRPQLRPRVEHTQRLHSPLHSAHLLPTPYDYPHIPSLLFFCNSLLCSLLSRLMSASSLPSPSSSLFCSLSQRGSLCVGLLAPRRPRAGFKGEAALGYSEQKGRRRPHKRGRYPTHTSLLEMAAQHR